MSPSKRKFLHSNRCLHFSKCNVPWCGGVKAHARDKELEGWVRSIQIDDLIATTKANVCWKFIPSRGPQHGGIYERMVRVAKRVLESLCHTSDLTVDEFRTLAYLAPNWGKIAQCA
jgi:hypothetical protein